MSTHAPARNAFSLQRPLPLPHLSAVRVSGRDAASFLQRQFAGDLRALAPGTPAYTCWCNPQGRVIADLLVLGAILGNKQTQGMSDYFLVAHNSQREGLIRGLQRYVMRDQVQIDASEQLIIHGYQTALQNQDSLNIPKAQGKDAAHQGCWALPWDNQRAISLSVITEVTAYAVDADPELGAIQQDDSCLQAWQALDIQAGVPWLPQVLSGTFLPQMLGLESLGAVSYSKGCYPGQEVIARTHYLGQVKRCCLLFTLAPLAHKPEIGATIYNHKDEDVGVLLAIVNNGKGNSALAVIHRDADRHSLHVNIGPHSTPLSYGESATCLNNSC